MKTLIVEDEFVSRLHLQGILKSYGPVDIAANGKEAVEPYDLICLDIMMPEMDGQAALKEIRQIEKAAAVTGSNRTRIVMTTACADQENLMGAIGGKCDWFLAKPIHKARLLQELRRLALID